MAFRAFFGILGGTLPEDIARAHGYQKAAAKRPEPQRETVKPEAGALQLLGLLQREARLIDFFMEDISPYADDQVGAGVRSIHAQCQELLRKHFRLAPVIDGVEGTYVKTESAGALAREAGAIRFTGNLPPQGKPAGGLLRHRGWRADAVSLPAVSAKQNLSILAPAELEVE
ncbi:MAG: hypothetical protein KatS3mg005_3486 [Bryobacteraceae bacterium]|nr:MAG: hypothetical protein KatS3mg005_3486 [Bryobacteraceae bacterium]